jgi:ornithine decarboxylase
MEKSQLLRLAREFGTPLFIIDHKVLRETYLQFKKYLPRVQAYYAVKSNPHPEIVRTLYKLGASFDVASMPEFEVVHDNIKQLPAKERQDFIWDKIIYANPIKAIETLEELDCYKILLTYDNIEEVKKIKKHAPHSGLVLRLQVPNTGSVVELSSKFGCPPGEAVDLMIAARDAGLGVEGISFHVGSQCTNFENYVQALHLSAGIFNEANSRGFNLNLLDIGGGFPAPYDKQVKPFRELARKINSEINRLFPKNIEILAEPGRFMSATCATLVAKIIGKADRNSKRLYYIDDGIYHTYSGVLCDHIPYKVKALKKGPTRISSVFGPTCDALDTISLANELPDLNIGDFVYTENIGAYTWASSTNFNGFPPAKVIHINQ